MYIMQLLWQPEIYDRVDQASLLRQEQMLKAQSLQSTSLDGGARYFSLMSVYCLAHLSN